MDPSRPRASWDHYLDVWSGGKWIVWARCSHTWGDLEDEWVQWSLRRIGVSMAEIPAVVLRLRHSLAPSRIDHTESKWNMTDRVRDGVFLACDSMVLVRTLQGRWAARTPWLSSFVRHANDLMDDSSQMLPLCTAHEGWWIAHVPRTSNSWSDEVA